MARLDAQPHRGGPTQPDGAIPIHLLGGLRPDLWVGRPVRFGPGLWAYPLRGPEPQEPPDYDLIGDALAAGRVEVDELKTASVRTLRVRVQGPRPVFVPEGTVLRGGLQTRTVNISLLLAEGEHPIPVSCVEAGRWGRYRTFGIDPLLTDARLRIRKVRSALDSLKTRREALADQTDVWACVDACLIDLGLHSPTLSYEAVLEARREDDVRADAEKAARRLKGAVLGVVVTHESRVLGADVFGHPATWEKMGGQLLESYASAARWADPTWVPRMSVKTFLGHLAEATPTVVPAPVGFGEHRLIEGPVEGFALVAEGCLVHLYAAPGGRKR